MTIDDRRCLESAESSRLRSDPVGLTVRHGTRSAAARALREHQARATQDRRVVLLGLLRHLAGLALLIVLLESLDGAGLLAEEVDHKRHREVVKAMSPRELEDHIRANEIVARVQHTHVTFSTANVHELSLSVPDP